MLKRSYIKKFGLLITCLLVILVTLGNCKKTKGPLQRGQKRDPLTVESEVLKPAEMADELYTTGTLMANEKVDLHSEVSGLITGIFFKEGTYVEQGKTLVKINDNDLQAQLKKIETQESLTSEEEFRQRKLLDLKAISQEEYDIVANQLSSVKAEKELLLAQIAKTVIKAPFSGTIGLRYVSPGGYVSPSTLIATLQQLDPMKIEFTIPEKFSKSIQRNMPVNFTTEESDKTFTGKVYAIESGIDVETRTIRVRALCSNPKNELIPGTFAKILITLHQYQNTLKIPSEALVTEITGSKAYIIKNGKAKSIPVTTGIHNDQEVQIISGLQPGDSLITTGLMQLSDGMPVNAKNK